MCKRAVEPPSHHRGVLGDARWEAIGEAGRRPCLLPGQIEFELPEDVTIWLVHGTGDDLLPIEQSRALAATGTPDRVRLIEVDDDHPLHRSVAAGLLPGWVRGVAEADRGR